MLDKFPRFCPLWIIGSDFSNSDIFVSVKIVRNSRSCGVGVPKSLPFLDVNKEEGLTKSLEPFYNAPSMVYFSIDLWLQTDFTIF